MYIEEIKMQREECKPPCVPRPMIGRSWWKCLGYNTPCSCAYKKKQEQGLTSS